MFTQNSNHRHLESTSMSDNKTIEDAKEDSVQILSGNIKIGAEGDGIQAESALYIYGGEYDIESVDDSIHSNGILEVVDGTLSIQSGD